MTERDKRIEQAEVMERLAVNLHISASELRALVEEQEPVGEPVAMLVGYVFRSKRDGSIGNEIAPVGWATFESQMEKIRQHPWLKLGQGEIIPLYTRPQASAPADQLEVQLGNMHESNGRVIEVDAFQSPFAGKPNS